jgi:hypothetical protein
MLFMIYIEPGDAFVEVRASRRVEDSEETLFNKREEKDQVRERERGRAKEAKAEMSLDSESREWRWTGA